MTETPASLPLTQWRAGPYPFEWNSLLGQDGPLHLEIGFGDGRYTARRALDDPTGRFIAIELSGVSVRRALKRMRRDRINNVALLKGEARFMLQHLFAPGSLETITVNFPDPWPKGRHEENRLLRRDFFQLAATRTVPDGRLLLATDHAGYLDFARDEARASGVFDAYEAEPPAAVFETKYALKWLGQGKPLFYQPFRRTGDPGVRFDILERPETMPHSLLQGELPETAAFSKIVLPFEDGHVIVHEAARVAGQSDRWLFLTTIDEPDLRQQVLVAIQSRGQGELIVRLESFGDPIVTSVARGAVHAVTQWALAQPGVTLKAKRY